MDISALLVSARARAGLSLRELAALAGTSHSAISAYESGRKTPSVATLGRILEAAGFAVDARLHRRHRGTPELPRGDELIAVLELAGAFPAHHDDRLPAPVFGRS